MSEAMWPIAAPTAQVISTARPARAVFLLGPPGVGKTELGTRACAALRWSLLPFTELPVSVVAAEVLEVPWEIALEPKFLERLRKVGAVIALWDRPEDMQVRASLPYVLRPSRAATLAPYGRRGTNCLEYRRLIRGCDEVLHITDLSIDEAAETLARLLRNAAVDQRPEGTANLAKRLADLWVRDHMTASRDTADLLARAMAEFVESRVAQGISARSLSALTSDLHVAGMLDLMYHQRSTANVLRAFEADASNEFEFARKVSDSPALVARYARACRAFAAFLRETI